MNALFDAVSSAGWLVYLLTFIFLFLEASGLPLPALSFALLAATLAGQGTLSFAAVVAATILGATLGGPVGHALGIRGGRPLLERMGSKVHITPERLDSTEEQFKKRGKSIVLIRFFIPVLPWSAGIFAGIARMPRGTLFLFNFIGITLWALIELTIVAFFSSALKDVLSRFTMAGVFWLATGVIGLFLLMRLFRRRRAARRAQLEMDADADLLGPLEVVQSEFDANSGAPDEPAVTSPATPMTTSSELPSLDAVQDKQVTTPGAAAGSSVPPGPD